MSDSAVIEGIEFRIGDRFRENDKRMNRVVTVVGWDVVNRRVRIKWAKETWARAARFDGRSSGYVRVA